MKRVVKKSNKKVPSIWERIKWKRVAAPGLWQPSVGEELVGYYGGRTTRSGRFGQYDAALVQLPRQAGSRIVSGVKILQLLDSAGLRIGGLVRITYLGMVPLGEGRSMRDFALDVEENEELYP